MAAKKIAATLKFLLFLPTFSVFYSKNAALFLVGIRSIHLQTSIKIEM